MRSSRLLAATRSDAGRRRRGSKGLPFEGYCQFVLDYHPSRSKVCAEAHPAADLAGKFDPHHSSKANSEGFARICAPSARREGLFDIVKIHALIWVIRQLPTTSTGNPHSMKAYIWNALARGLIVAAALASTMAVAQQGKAIKFLVPYPPGGGTDLAARLIAPRLADKLGQPVVVENRVGASGNIAMEAVAKADPDGLTIAVAFSGITINAVLDPKLRYNPVKDFAPITKLADNTLVLVANPAFSAKDLKEVLAEAKRRPGQITYGSAGTATGMHLMGELISLSGDVKMLHIPYKGNGPLVNELMGGQIPLAISDLASTTSFIKSGRLRAIAVGGAKRSILAPDIPTVAEAGFPGFAVLSWTGVIAPVGTPTQLVQAYSAHIGEILGVPEIREKLMAVGLEPAPTTPEEFAAIIRGDLAKWDRTIKATGVRPE